MRLAKASYLHKVGQSEFKQSSGVFEVGDKETEFPHTST